MITTPKSLHKTLPEERCVGDWEGPGDEITVHSQFEKITLYNIFIHIHKWIYSLIPSTVLGGRAITIPLKKKRRLKHRSQVTWPSSPNVEVRYGWGFEWWISLPWRDKKKGNVYAVCVCHLCATAWGGRKWHNSGRRQGMMEWKFTVGSPEGK